MSSLHGTAASNGISIGKAFVLQEPNIVIEEKNIEQPERELEHFKHAINLAVKDLERIKTHTEEQLGASHAKIFEAHLMVLQDPELINAVKAQIEGQKINAEKAMNDVANQYINIFENMNNSYMKERAADIRDVSKRVIAYLLGEKIAGTSDITEEVILIAHDLLPSDTAQLNRNLVKGIVTDIGGRTSHSAIIARSMEIPAVVGTSSSTEQIEAGMMIIVDGSTGEVIVDPDEETLATYKKKKEALDERKSQLKSLVNEKSISKDGKQVELAANIGSPKDLEAVIKNGAEGVGLFRTEFLYMDRSSLPTENEQYEAYSAVLEKLEGKPVVIRTLDIGGDKDLPYLDLPKELNPFLGFRAIRLCLERDDIFRTQLRALLRASTHGQLKIMFPMIATIEEFRQAKQLLEEERQSLIDEGVSVNDSIEIGIMVEIPSTAMIADLFAEEVDFFSIGTNDLIQYTLAADRMNEHVSYLYQPYHPAILRLIDRVIKAAHNKGKWVGMCGEMAGDEKAIPILLGLGLDEFSMSASSILEARKLINELSYEKLKELTPEILKKQTSDEVYLFVERLLKDGDITQ
ncbi:phosphoenolpyruvate--protein phosphotransferase [Piscibacillus halophilus]|uniref:phosphoenolpyruvate--protein phosphotransferase n=1 Tax=Piscibacillus halophilus TaxID=571933 RepID=UPI0024091484|nr:phosphoenolpyruvate--protein phosphotransferase [Piscibacillus halophilus]